MSLFNRNTLKNFFKNGASPTESHFSDLIDSTINKLDDGFSKSINDGLQLSPMGESRKLISFYEDIRDKDPDWQFVIHPKEDAKGLSLAEGGGAHRMFFKRNGNVGIDTLFPKTNLDVNGTTSTKSRVGSYAYGEVPADGEWHPVIDELTGCHIFEIVAKAAAGPGRGKYAVAHAIAVNTYNSRRSRVKVTRAWHGSYWSRLVFRWAGTPENYSLQVRTRRSYGLADGKPFPIKFHMTNLWDDALFK